MDRRQALRLTVKGGIAFGLLGGAGLYGRYRFLPPAPSEHPAPVDELAARLFDSMDPGMRDEACVAYDHPYRQYHNRGVYGGGMEVDGKRFTWQQRSILTDLLHAGLSQPGRSRLPKQFFIGWPGVQRTKLLICGEPGAHCQIVLTGPHLNLRLGGKSREGVAFGGPMVYGDQRGDSRQGLPRNVYRYQFRIANRLFEGLEPDQQRAALSPRAPIQTRIELQGRHGTFPGIPLGELSHDNHAIARELVDGILSTYAETDVAYAWHCLEENGGIDSLCLSYYEDGEVDGSGTYQIFRLEGPAAVFYFRGFPHVHAFLNVALDGDSPLSLGEVLGENPQVLESVGVAALFENAMGDLPQVDLAYYPEESAVGRLRKGTIRTGDIYTLESWQDRVAIGTIPGSRIGGALLERLERAGQLPHPDRVYQVATSDEVARYQAAASVGQPDSWERGMAVRDAVIAHVRRQGFPVRT